MAKKKTSKKVLKEEVAIAPPPILDPPKTYQCRGCKKQFPAVDSKCPQCGREDTFRVA